MSLKGVVLSTTTVLLLLVGAGSASAQVSKHPFEIVPGSFGMSLSTGETVSSVGEPVAGSPEYQAGAHANWTFKFDYAHNSVGQTYNDLKDTVINIPAGFMASGNKFDFPTCTDAQLVGKNAGKPECPINSQIGTITLDLTVDNKPVLSTFPVYFMEDTSYGVTAELGFNAVEIVQIIPVYVRPGDSGLTSIAPDSEDVGEPRNVTVTIWGVPAAKEHNPERGMVCYQSGSNENEPVCHGGNIEAEAGEGAMPFLSNPTSCGTFTASLKADSWEEPQPAGWLFSPVEAGPLTQTAQTAAITGCERIHFDPAIVVQPTTSSAESPSGLNVTLEVPQTWNNANTFATSNLKDTRVTLPEGYTVNPSAGNGLVGCTPAEYEAETSSSPPGAGCPPESKLGKVTIETPLLAETIRGDVFLAMPYDNPFSEPNHPNGSLLALYIVAKAPDRGIIVKTAGKVEPDPVTGRLVTTFNNTPQQPFSKFTLEFKQGQTSPLVSPPVCGKYGVLAELTPWSAPTEPRLVSNELEIEHGIAGGPCPAGGVPPFSPTVISGTEDNAAGSFSPFYLRIERKDGEQEITKFSTVMPPGLTGDLTGIPFCPGAAIEAARAATGAQEIEHPSCPAASEVGHSVTEAGVGTVLAQAPGKLYLAGPYHDAPFSLVSVTSAKVGPFDLGTVVIRFALFINQTTGQVEVSGAQSDPIPHIIAPGIIVHVRNIRAYVDREHFTLNPTSCDPMQIQEAITGAGADPANPADQNTVPVNARFQAADCARLAFKPIFKASTSGKTSRSEGASLHVTLTMPGALGTNTNIRSVKVDLPKQLPSNLEALKRACIDTTFDANPAACPAESRVGFAKAITPILPVPLEGPAYFVSHGGAKFPELIVVLQGYGVTIELHGETFIDKAGITSSTFRTIPDEPVGSFELTLPQRPKFAALAAPGGLCNLTKTKTVKKKVTLRSRNGKTRTVTHKAKQTVATSLGMPTAFTAQNGAVIHQNTPIEVTGCGRAKKKAKASRHRGHVKQKK